MAMADSSNNQQNNKTFDRSYYSRFKINNIEEGLTLSANFRSGLLIPTITKKTNNYGDRPEELASVNLSPNKAAILAEIGKTYLVEGTSDTTVHGVDTGIGETRGFFGFTNLEDGRRAIMIGKIAPDGTYTGVTFPFHTDDYNYSLSIGSMKTMDFVKNPVSEDFEIKQLIDLLEDFARTSNDAIGYSVADTIRYDINKINSANSLICEALNINTKFNNNKPGGSSFLDNKNTGAASSSNTNRGRSNHMSNEEIDDLLG